MLSNQEANRHAREAHSDSFLQETECTERFSWLRGKTSMLPEIFSGFTQALEIGLFLRICLGDYIIPIEMRLAFKLGKFRNGKQLLQEHHCRTFCHHHFILDIKDQFAVNLIKQGQELWTVFFKDKEDFLLIT